MIEAPPIDRAAIPEPTGTAITTAESSAAEETAEHEGYRPTDAEIAAIQKLSEKKRQTATPRISVEQTAPNRVKVAYNHEALGIAQILLSNAIGCADSDFREGLLSDLLNASVIKGKVDETRLNMGLAVVKDIKPTDAVEAMLAAQMFALHSATMVYAQRTLENDLVEDAAEPCLNRLARTFAAQVEALKKYRTGGEQRVTVQHQHVNVNEGGQAIVGNVSQGAGGQQRNGGQIHETDVGRAALPPPSGTALPIAFAADKAAMRSAGGERQDSMPLPRSSRGSPKRQSEQSQARALQRRGNGRTEASPGAAESRKGRAGPTLGR